MILSTSIKMSKSPISSERVIFAGVSSILRILLDTQEQKKSIRKPATQMTNLRWRNMNREQKITKMSS
jgi:hypothetical protein